MSDHVATLFRAIATGFAFVGLGGLVLNFDFWVSIILLIISVTILLVVADVRKER